MPSFTVPADLVGTRIDMIELAEIMEHRKKRKTLSKRLSTLDARGSAISAEIAKLIDAEGTILANADDRNVVAESEGAES